MVAIVIAASTETTALFWLGTLIGGAGFGVAFLGGLRALSVAIPPQHRAEVMSAFYVVAYLAISVPAVIAGVLVTPLGLHRPSRSSARSSPRSRWRSPSRPTARAPLAARVAMELA